MIRCLLQTAALVALSSGVLFPGGGAQASDLRFTLGEYSEKTRPFFERVARDYQAKHPDTHVEIEVVPWDSYLQRLTTDISAGSPPDLAVVASTWVPDLDAQGVIEPLDPLMSPAFRQTFIPTFLAPATINGRLMGVPAAASTRAMVVNTDLLKRAGAPEPKTWSDFVEAAKKVSALPDVRGFGLPGTGVEVDTYFYYALWSLGGDIFKDGRSGLDRPEAIKAAELYKSLIDQKATEPSPTAYSREEVFQSFKQGKIGMVFSYPMLVPQLKAEAPGLHYAILPFPTDRGPITLGVTDVMVLFHGPHAKEAWDFAQFTFGDTYRSEFDRAEGLLPVTQNVAAEDYFTKNPDLSTFAAGLAYARFVPTVKNWPQFADITTRALQSIYLGDSTPEAAMTDAARQIDAALAGP